MGRTSWWWAVVLVGCDGETSGDAGDDGGDVVDSDADPITGPTGTTGDTGTGIDLACFADYTWDFDDDGAVEIIGVDLYDPVRTDLLVHYERQFGSLLASADYTYDEDGNLLTFSYDDGADGTVDYLATYSYDEAGNVITGTVDEDGDGVLDYQYQNVRDAEGRRVSATEDLDGDGATDRWFTYTYDAVGRLTQITADEENDGTIDYLWTTTFSDPKLLIGMTVIDVENDGVVDEIQIFEADASGRILHREVDQLADGYADLLASFVYDPVTGLLLQEDQEQHEPPPEYDNVRWDHTEYQYDELLRLVDQYEEDAEILDGVEDDGVSRQTWTFAGSCP